MDPRQLKRQAFWIALLASVAILGALFALLIVPRQNEIKKLTVALQSLTTQLMQASSDPVGHPDVISWETYQKELAQKIADTVAFYRKTDERLEEWLPDLGIRSAETPDSGQFLAKYQDKEIELDHRFPWADETTQDDKGWRNVKARDLQELAEKRGAQAVAGAMRDMQKIHWIRSRFAKSLMPTIQAEAQLPAGQRSLRIRRIVFVRDVYDRWGAPSGVATRAGHMRGFPGIPERVEDFQLPGELGSCITFCADFTVSIAELPKILRDLLSYEPKEGERPMLVELLGIRVKTEDTAPFERSIEVPAHHTPEQKAQAAEDARISQRPLPVRVFLSVRIVDFDAAKLGEIAAKQQQGKG